MSSRKIFRNIFSAKGSEEEKVDEVAETSSKSAEETVGDNADEIPDKPQEIEAAASVEAEAELTAEGTTKTTAEAGPSTDEAGAAGDENASDIKEIAVEEDENSDDENLICTCPCCCCLCSCIKSITRIHSAQGGLEAGGIFCESLNFEWGAIFHLSEDSKQSVI